MVVLAEVAAAAHTQVQLVVLAVAMVVPMVV
jgi:hypothetical protein